MLFLVLGIQLAREENPPSLLRSISDRERERAGDTGFPVKFRVFYSFLFR